MDLSVFRRAPDVLTSRTSTTTASTHSVSTDPLDASGAQASSRASSSGRSISPRPFYSLSTPSTTMFSIFAKPQTPYRPDDQIIEVDEASGYNTHGRRYSSIVGSPASIYTGNDGTVPASFKNDGRPRRDRRRSSLLQGLATGGPGGPGIRTQSAWRRRATWLVTGGYRPRRSLLRRVCSWSGAIGLFLFCFALIFILPTDLQVLAPVVIGSLLSFISSMTIVVSYLFQEQNRRYPNELLVYVAICEFGLAVLALVHVMTYCSGTTNCVAMSFEACTVATGLEMFLLLASIGWFGCAILHLFVSVSNPFANYKSQLKRYHLTVWLGSIVLSVAVPLVVFSRSTQTRYEMSGAEICRTVGLNFPMLSSFTTDEERALRINQWQTLNMEYWGAMFALVVLLVIAAQFILAVGWWRSNSGTVIALKARRRMMQRMTTYVHTLNATWLVILVVFFWYRSDPGAMEYLAAWSDRTLTSLTSDEGPHILDAIFHFILAAKGYFTCVVWIAVNRHCCAASRILCGDWQSVPIASRTNDVRGYMTDDEDDDEDDADDDVDVEGGRPTAQLTWNSTTAPRGLQGVRHSSSSSGRPSFLPMNTPGTPPSTPPITTDSAWASQNNETLQREIIYYTVCGITKSILKSAQNPDTDVFFQQLMVGVPDRDSTAPQPPTVPGHYHHHHSISSQLEALGHSPRAYCQSQHRPCSSSFQQPTHSMAMSSLGPSASFAAVLDRPDDVGSNHSGSFHSQSTATCPRSTMTTTTTTTTTPPSHPPNVHTPHRYSLYPVSHVPFELFEQEIELESQRSSTSSIGFSPLFASLRRTATALQSKKRSTTGTRRTTHSRRGSTTTTTTGTVDDPRPKMFIDYAPTEFRAIRKAFGLSDEMYLASFRSTAKERVSAGSSGAFMFFSGDNALIVKSMKEKECRKLVHMIPTYADYITTHPKSRIIRFFGCHRIRLYGRNFYFVVMSNVLHSMAHTTTITEKYDVKGSWIDRQAKLPQTGDTVTCSECNATYEVGRGDVSTTFPFHVHRPDTILKDLDMKRALHMDKRVARDLYAQLVMDCEFLNSMGIMDYSLLVGVHKCTHPELPWHREFVGSASLGGRDKVEQPTAAPSSGVHLAPIPEDCDYPEEMYFVGIIDILQEWNWEKQLEKVGKMLIGKSSSGISAVAPNAYCDRFKARVAQVLRLHELDVERAIGGYQRTSTMGMAPSMASTVMRQSSADLSMPMDAVYQEADDDDDEGDDEQLVLTGVIEEEYKDDADAASAFDEEAARDVEEDRRTQW